MHRIHLLKERLNSRSFKHAFRRFHTVLQRYGFNESRFTQALIDFIQLVNRYHITPTLPITASIIKKYPSFINQLKDFSTELAVHGFQHIDYRYLDTEKARNHLEDALKIFTKQNIQSPGFRFPYLSRDSKRLDIIGQVGYPWDSSEVIIFDIIEPKKYSAEHWSAFQKYIQFYNAENIHECFSLPYKRKNLIEIPVSLPDDDILVDQLFMQDGDEIFHVWKEMFQIIYTRGEMLVLQVHPERFYQFQKALVLFFEDISGYSDIWFASLDTIAKWWKEKENFTVRLQNISKNKYRIQIQCSERAHVYFQSKKNVKIKSNDKNQAIVKNGYFEFTSPKKPVIGVHPTTSESVLSFLKDEGYPYLVSEHNQSFGFYIKKKENLPAKQKVEMLSDINKTDFPLIRFGRWPDQKHCCLAISGDIDSINYWDFVTRFYE